MRNETETKIKGKTTMAWYKSTQIHETEKYKGLTITVLKHQVAGGHLYSASSDSGEPYTSVPVFFTPAKAIAWDKKNIDFLMD